MNLIDNTEETAREVAALVEKVKPALAGRAPELQGAALAQLLAIWLGLHFIPGEAEKTAGLRGALLANHLAYVMVLTKVNSETERKT